MEDFRWYLAPAFPRSLGETELVEGYLDVRVLAADPVKDSSRWIIGKNDEKVLRLGSTAHGGTKLLVVDVSVASVVIVQYLRRFSPIDELDAMDLAAGCTPAGTVVKVCILSQSDLCRKPASVS